MSRPDEFKLWNRMPPGTVKVDAPDGTLTIGDSGLSTSTLYDSNTHPLIQSGDWQVPHQRYGQAAAPTTRNRNGR
jgi:hypothetical protein